MPGVQHVGIGQHHVGALADGAARVLRRVAIVGERADFASPSASTAPWSSCELVLGERLGGKQIHRARAGFGDQAFSTGRL